MIRQPVSPRKDAVVELAGGGTSAVDALARDVAYACARIAPLWPLEHFVAVNPFLGHTGERFEAAAATLARVTGARMFMPRGFYAAEIAAGRITDGDLEQALAAREAGRLGLLAADPREALPTVAMLRAAAACDGTHAQPAVQTVADVADAAHRTGWSAAITGEIAKVCAGYYDRGQAAWRLPARDAPLFRAWRDTAAIDRTLEAAGLAGCRAYVAALPAQPLEAIRDVVAQLALPPAAIADYLHRALASVGGWAAFVRGLAWTDALHGRENDALVHLLAIRVACDGALLAAQPALDGAWRACVATMAHPRIAQDAALAAQAIDALLHAAYEIAHQRRLLAMLAATPAVPGDGARPFAQAAFCIDVRSEIFRRALETVAPEVRTLGFAGFFGFPIEYIPIGRDTGRAQCPVLLTPQFRVRETVHGADAAEGARVMQRRRVRRRAAAAWKSFKTSAVSCFAFVEAAGVAFAGKLAAASFGGSRRVPHPATDGLDRATLARVGPEIERRPVHDHANHHHPATGFSADERVAMAEAVLRAMSMTDGFARLVLLAGHGSTTVNNPHATGLDCGACGGHTGEANARVAAAILNDPGVRKGLHGRGLPIPADTWFLAALHDTTLDDVRLFDAHLAPAGHQAEIAALERCLARAGQLARGQRAALLGLGDASAARVDADIARRARDWSEVRPEWGLAGNVAFVAAPRRRTRGLDLGGRVFLHEYDCTLDTTGATLELIMTAPLVVASWINLQYYGSTVDNDAFGSGNKLLHNVVGATLGVVEGNGGDLRVGLPRQSVHDGTRLVHEPLRLNVFIEAPVRAVQDVIAKHAGVRQLLDNGWVHLFVSEGASGPWQRYQGAGAWGPAGTA